MKKDIRTLSKDKSLVAMRRKHIAKCAAHILAYRGYSHTTISAVAEACNMAVGTLYHYVGSKDDIVYLVLEWGTEEIKELWLKVMRGSENLTTATELLQRAIRAHCEAAEKHQDVILIMYREIGRVNSYTRRYILETELQAVAQYEKVLSRGCNTGEFRIQNITMMAHDILIIGEMWAVRRWAFRQQFTLEEYIKQQTERVLKSISKEFHRELDLVDES